MSEKFNLPNQESKNHLYLPNIEKSLPPKEKLDALFANNVLVESPEGKKYILQQLTRIAVIANVNGVKIPFYQSSTGTDGKHAEKWYPFFGNVGAWLIKGNVEDLNRGYGIPEIKEMMDYLDATVPEYLYENLLNENQKQVFKDPTWKRSVGKTEEVKERNKEFIIDQDEAAHYMADVLGYDLANAPEESSDERTKTFVPEMLESIKRRLGVFNKF